MLAECRHTHPLIKAFGNTRVVYRSWHLRSRTSLSCSFLLDGFRERSVPQLDHGRVYSPRRDVVELGQRVHNFDERGPWTKQFPLRGVLFTLRLCICLSSILTVPSSGEWSVIWVEEHRPHYPLKSWPCSLTRTCCFGWGGRFQCSFLSPFREQSNVLFDESMTRELMAVCQGSGNFGTSPDFPGCAGVPPHKNPS